MPEKLVRIPCGYLIVKPEEMFGNIDPAIWKAKYPPLSGNRIRIAMNSLFIDTGEEKILIDPGMSEEYSPETNIEIEYTDPIPEYLRSAGTYPSDIHLIILTHLHFDHCAGIFQYHKNLPCRPAFPEATIILSNQQYLNILQPCDAEKDSFIKDFRYYLEKYYPLKIINEEEGKLTKETGFRKFSGHSPGMIVPFIQTENKTLVYTSDLIPLSINAEMKVVSSFDLDMEKSLLELTGFLDEAKEKKYELFLYHETEDFIMKKF